MSFDLGKLISSVAPTLATMLGGPLAGTAVSAIAQAFGLAPDTTAEDVAATVQAKGMTPEIIAAMRKADQEHELALRAADIDVLKLNAAHDEALYTSEVADRDSARKREAALPNDTTARNLAYLVVCGGIAMVAFVLSGQSTVDSVLAGTLIGYVVGEMKSVLSYYFGSSAGSANKEKLLTAQANAKAAESAP